MSLKQNLIISIFVLLLASPSFAYDNCGDGICGTTESSYNCKTDCPSGAFDLFCDGNEDGICDADCKGNDPDCSGHVARLPGEGNNVASGGTDKNAMLKLGLGAVFVIALAIIIILFIRKLKKG